MRRAMELTQSTCPLRPSYHIVSSGKDNQFLITGLGKHGLRE